MKPKQTWNDLMDGVSAGKYYHKKDTRQMEHDIRYHIDGMNNVERRRFYGEYFRQKK